MNIAGVELLGATHSTTAVVDLDCSLGELLPTFVALVGDAPSGEWIVSTWEGRRLGTTQSLTAEGIGPGARLMVARKAATLGLMPDPELMDAPPPALPRPIDPARRVLTTVAAFIGWSAIEAGSDGSALDRARAAWMWTDRRRRLEWMIRVSRTSRIHTIGVLSAGTDGSSVAVELAETLAACRPEPVTLVQCRPGTPTDPEHMGASLPAGSGSIPTSRPLVHRIAVGDEDTTTAMVALRSEVIRHRSGLVVIDCGKSIAPVEMCAQLVIVSRHPNDPPIARNGASRRAVLVSDRPHRSRLTDSFPDLAGIVDIDSEYRALETTALLAGMWTDRTVGVQAVGGVHLHPRAVS